MIKIKITRKHRAIVYKIYQFIQQTDLSLLNFRKSMTMRFNKILLWHSPTNDEYQLSQTDPRDALPHEHMQMNCMAQLDRASTVASIVNLDRPITAVQFITPNFQLCRTELTTRRDDVVTFFLNLLSPEFVRKCQKELPLFSEKAEFPFKAV